MKRLFETVQLGPLVLRNRVFMAPLTRNRADADGVPSELAAERGIVDGTLVRITKAAGSVVLAARVDASLASNVLRIPAAHPLTAALGPMFGALELAVENDAHNAGVAAASAA